MLHIMRRLGYDHPTSTDSSRTASRWCASIAPNQLINDITYDLLRYAAPDERIQRINQTWFSMVVNHLFSDRLKVMPGLSEHHHRRAHDAMVPPRDARGYQARADHCAHHVWKEG